MKDSKRKSLYVGNLARETTEDKLRELFATDGRVVEAVKLALDRRTGRSRGFGFVEMGSVEEAVAALEAIRGTELDGRPIKVGNAYREKAGSTEAGGYDERRDGGGRKRGKY